MKLKNLKFYKRETFAFYFYKTKPEDSFYPISHWQVALGYIGIYRFTTKKEMRKVNKENLKKIKL